LTVDPTKPYTITQAPRVIRGRVVIGNSGAEYGVRGYISAYDSETGKLAWRFYTVPGDPAQKAEDPILVEAAKTWKGEWWKRGGGGTVWESLSYDPGLNLIYFGVGNGIEWDHGYRSRSQGDNWFLSSIVAINADTGKVRRSPSPEAQPKEFQVATPVMAPVAPARRRRYRISRANMRRTRPSSSRCGNREPAAIVPKLCGCSPENSMARR
jgi:hypothetical protein